MYIQCGQFWLILMSSSISFDDDIKQNDHNCALKKYKKYWRVIGSDMAQLWLGSREIFVFHTP